MAKKEETKTTAKSSSKKTPASNKTATKKSVGESKKPKKQKEVLADIKTKKKKVAKEENWGMDDDGLEEMDAPYEYEKCPPVYEDSSPFSDGEEKPTLTRRGLEILTKELKELKQVKRLEVAERIRQARALGDITENSEYEEAKRDQAMHEARIIELEHILQSAIIVEESTGEETCVRVGTKIKVENLSTKAKETFKIVGTLEADPLKNLISNSSPFGRAMIGRQVKEVVKVLTPEGFIKYRILEIKKGN